MVLGSDKIGVYIGGDFEQITMFGIIFNKINWKKEKDIMPKLLFSGSKRSNKNLSRVQKSIDRFLKKNTGELSKRGHKTLRKLLNKRAKALSKATGMKIHSMFE